MKMRLLLSRGTITFKWFVFYIVNHLPSINANLVTSYQTPFLGALVKQKNQQDLGHVFLGGHIYISCIWYATSIFVESKLYSGLFFKRSKLEGSHFYFSSVYKIQQRSSELLNPQQTTSPMWNDQDSLSEFLMHWMLTKCIWNNRWFKTKADKPLNKVLVMEGARSSCARWF